MTVAVNVKMDSRDLAWVTLRNEGRRNAFSYELAQDFLAALGQVAGDPTVRAVVLQGFGEDFCVGADLRSPAIDRVISRRDPSADLQRLREATEIPRRILDLHVPVIANIDGGCAGAGLSIALAADVRICSHRAVFNTAFVAVGLSGDLGSAWLLTRTLGPSAARRLLLQPEKVSATEAHRLGLVDEVTNTHDERAGSLAHRMASNSALAIANAKQNVLDSDLPWETYVARETQRMVECAHSADSDHAAEAAHLRRTGDSLS